MENVVSVLCWFGIGTRVFRIRDTRAALHSSKRDSVCQVKRNESSGQFPIIIFF